MIELLTADTPNGKKISIMLEEINFDYKITKININEDEQFKPEFLAISPNNRIPAIVDEDGPGGESLSVFESGAILVYLAEKTGSELLPTEPRARAKVMEWLMWQMGGLGPMVGQAHHFMFNPKEVVPYGEKRYREGAKRLDGGMNTQLGKNEYMAGDAYSIADIACYPCISRFERHQVDLNDFPNVKRWFEQLTARPGVERGMAVPFAN